MLNVQDVGGCVLLVQWTHGYWRLDYCSLYMYSHLAVHVYSKLSKHFEDGLLHMYFKQDYIVWSLYYSIMLNNGLTP